MLFKLASLSISSLCKLDDETNKFYDRKHDLYEAALLTRCYTKHALRPYIGSKINHIRHFIKIPFINKGIEFIDFSSSWCLGRAAVCDCRIPWTSLFRFDALTKLGAFMRTEFYVFLY